MPNAFGCPERTYLNLTDPLAGPLYRAVLRLGPLRVQWGGHPPANHRTGKDHQGGYGGDKNLLTCWLLDGKRATYEELYTAAGMTLDGPRGRKTYDYRETRT